MVESILCDDDGEPTAEAADKCVEQQLDEGAGNVSRGNAATTTARVTSSAGSWLGPDPELEKPQVQQEEVAEPKEAGELREVSILEELLGIKPVALGAPKEEEPEPETPPTALPAPSAQGTQRYFTDEPDHRRGATHTWGDHMRAVPMNNLGQPLWQQSQHQQISGYHQ